jgi:uncharacterized membrane protein (UPF0127 family)
MRQHELKKTAQVNNVPMAVSTPPRPFPAHKNNAAQPVVRAEQANVLRRQQSVQQPVMIKTQSADTNGWIGVDLDGCLATHDGWKGDDYIGRPIKKMMDRVKKWLADGEQVKIMTTRANNGADAISAVQDWTYAHLGSRLPVTATKDKEMKALWDDRVHKVEQNTGVKQAAMLKEVPLKLVTPAGHVRTKFKAELADTPETRRTGLSKRASMRPATGMLFDTPGPFWMRDVNFPLDIVYLDKQGTVIETGHMVKPPPSAERIPDMLMPRYQSKSAAVAYALEMPAGWSDSVKLEPGYRLEIDKDAPTTVY